MESFWKWLTAANARGVFIGALVGLAGVLGYWIWNEVTAKKPVAIAIPAKFKYDVQAKPALIDFLVNDAFTSRYESVESPFMPPVRKKKDPSPPPETTPTEPKVAVSPPAPPAPPPPKPPKPEVKKICVVYRGRIVQPEGQVVALFEDQFMGRTRTYKPGSLLYGFKIGEIGLKVVALISENGATNLLRLGRSEAIKEQDHVE